MWTLVLLHLLVSVTSQVALKQTALVNHLTSKQTTAMSGDRVTVLEEIVRSLQTKITELQNQQKAEKAHYLELEKRLKLTNAETVTLHSDVIQLLGTQAEVQAKLAVFEENIGDLQLETKEFGFTQKQLKTDMANWQTLKDNVRRSQRKLEKRLKASIAELDTKIGGAQRDAQKVKDECDLNFIALKNEATDMKTFIENNTLELKDFIQNRTVLHKTQGKPTLAKRFDRLFKIYNVTRPTPNESEILHRTDDPSGTIDPEFLIPKSDVNKDWNEVGSGEVGSGESMPVLPTHSHYNFVKKGDLLLELQERDLEITTLLDMYDNLKKGLAVMEGRIHEIQLGNFMEHLQESFINFTQNVLTMDQWKMASGQLINTTQVNQQQISSLTNMIFNNSHFLRELELKISNAQSLSYQQFTLLRIHIIQLNNTVQDMKEEWNRNWKNRVQNTQSLPPPVHVHTIKNGHENLETLHSRIEDIALQVVYNENRIAKLEIKMLNESLSECKKVNADIYQDARIQHVENSMMKISEASEFIKKILTQVQQEMYREYLVNRNQSEVINVIIQDIGKVDQILPQISSVQQQIYLYQQMLPQDCYGYHRRGFRDSGVYLIRPGDLNISMEVYCDLENGADGWTVIQRRKDGSVDFDQPWNKYKYGFGSIQCEFWLGNDLIHLLTTSNTTLKIEMVDIHNVRWTIFYDNFAIASESENYKISISGFHGNTTDSFSYSNGMGFSTYDADNDGSSSHCAMFYTSGWWYKHCHYSNLNGRFRLGMVWYNFDEDEWIQLKYSEMKIKPSIGQKYSNR